MVLVMSSIRKPKRLTIIGSDEKEHAWLIKCGEDLRLDQRVQQMFAGMNDAIKDNEYCSRYHVALKTYKVVPLCRSVGMIEWVLNTKPLKACMETVPGFEAEFGKAYNAFNSLISKHSSGASNMAQSKYIF